MRKARNKTQFEIAKFMSISQNTYSYWESGKVRIDNDSLKKLAQYYGVTLDFLSGRQYKITTPVSAWRPDLQEDYKNADQYGKIYLEYCHGDIIYIDSESTIYDKITLSNKWIVPYFKDKYIDMVTVPVLYEWQDWLWRQKNERTGGYFSYKYLDKIRGVFSSFWTWYSLRYDTPNFFEKLQKPKKRASKTEMQFWTQDEFEKFIAVVDDPEYHCLFTLLFYTGRRKGEILALQSLDIQRDHIIINKNLSIRTLDNSKYKLTSTKADKKQRLPTAAPVQAELSRYQGKAPFFFGGDKPLHFNTVGRYFNRYIDLAGVKKIRLHDLRHSFVSMLIHLGANLLIVADLIGDTVEQVIKTYGHLYNNDQIEVLSRISCHKN